MKKAARQNEKNTLFKWASWIYIFGMLLCAALAYSDDVLDRTFLPRFATSFLCLSLTSCLLLFSQKNIRWPKLNGAVVLLGLFFLWNLQSLFWVDTFSEALLEVQRVFLSFGVFWLTLLFLENDTSFEKKIFQSAIALGGIAVLFGAYQLLQIDGISKLSLYQVNGISGHRNLFGALLFLLLGFSLLGRIVLEDYWKKMATIIAVAILILLLVLQARSAWLGLVVGTIATSFILLLKQKDQQYFNRSIFIVLLIAVGITLSWNFYQDGMTSFLERINVANYLESETAVERLRLWDKTMCTFWQSPWMGVGAGNWQTHFAGCGVHGLYSIELNDVTYQRPHNDFLWVLAENGLLGFGLYFSFLILIFSMAIKSIFRKERKKILKIAVLLGTFLGYQVIAGFSFPKERIELLIWSYTLFAILFWETQPKEEKVIGNHVLTRILLMLFFMGSCFSGYTLWKRAIGEYEMNQIYFLKAAQNWQGLLSAVEQGESPFYRLDPNAIPMKWYEGTANFSLGKFELAEDNFRVALQIAPYSQHCWNDLGSCLEKLGQRQEAMECYNKALVISPLFDDPKLNLGICHFKNKDFAQAKRSIMSMRDSVRARPYLETIERVEKEQGN